MKRHDCEYGDTGRCVHCHKHDPASYAYGKSSDWLALGNEYSEKGNKKQAERCFEKSTHWLVRYNKLIGDG